MVKKSWFYAYRVPAPIPCSLCKTFHVYFVLQGSPIMARIKAKPMHRSSVAPPSTSSAAPATSVTSANSASLPTQPTASPPIVQQPQVNGLVNVPGTGPGTSNKAPYRPPSIPNSTGMTGGTITYQPIINPSPQPIQTSSVSIASSLVTTPSTMYSPLVSSAPLQGTPMNNQNYSNQIHIYVSQR